MNLETCKIYRLNINSFVNWRCPWRCCRVCLNSQYCCVEGEISFLDSLQCKQFSLFASFFLSLLRRLLLSKKIRSLFTQFRNISTQCASILKRLFFFPFFPSLVWQRLWCSSLLISRPWGEWYELFHLLELAHIMGYHKQGTLVMDCLFVYWLVVNQYTLLFQGSITVLSSPAVPKIYHDPTLAERRSVEFSVSHVSQHHRR